MSRNGYSSIVPPNIHNRMDDLLQALGSEVVDAEEETFELFSQPIPSRDLGFVDAKATTVDLTVAGRDICVHQSPSLLTSSRKEGTTGAVLWKASPLFAEWISNPHGLLLSTGCIGHESVVVELGCGVSGVISLALAPRVRRYIATDQDYVLKLLRRNIEENAATLLVEDRGRVKKRFINRSIAIGSACTDGHANTNIYPMVLDWELHSASNVSNLLSSDRDDGVGGVDAVLTCDCIYNEALIEPLVDACADICRLRAPTPTLNPTICIVAQQLRSPVVFSSWLRRFRRQFSVYRVPEKLMLKEFGVNSGFVVHVGILREDASP